jgi:hypothetical protein
MATARLFSTRVRSWEVLNESLESHLPDMPHVQALHDELASLIGTARGLDVEQEEARSRLFDLIHRRQEVERLGEIVRLRVEAHLRGTFGHSSDQLIQFGIRPRRRIRRTRQPETPPAPPEPPDETPPDPQPE